MLVIDYKDCYFESVVELEKQVYPEALCLGPEMLREELNKPHNHSKVVFSDGKLLGYIISYDFAEKDEDEKKYSSSACYTTTRDRYISDLNCTNKKALWHLLACYFNGIYRKTIIHAECREKSLKLIENKKYKSAISVLNTEELYNYYSAGEHAVKVVFSFDPEHVDDWRIQFANSISGDNKVCKFSDFLDFINSKKLNAEELKKSKNFVLATVNEHNLDIFRMFGTEVPVRTTNTIKFSSDGKALSSYIKKLENAGMKENSAKDPFSPGEYQVCNSTIIVCNQSIYKNEKAYNDLSSARYFFNSITKQRKKGKYSTATDRFGERREIYKIPYCNKLTWETEMKYVLEERNMNQRVFGDNSANTIGSYNAPGKCFRNLGKIIGFAEASRNIHKIIDRYKENLQTGTNKNFIHDWNVIIEKLISAKSLLTKGAIVSCLNSSYNAAFKMSETIESINIVSDSFREGRRKKSEKMMKRVKDIRKELSRRIRSGQELESLLSEISAEVQKLNELKYNLTKIENDKIAVYIERMGKYIQHIDATLLIKSLGKTFVKNMLAGNCPGLFTTKTYLLGTARFCVEIAEILKTSSRKAKRLYNDLRQGGYLEQIQNSTLTSEQHKAIEKILKFRNCAVSKNILDLQCFTAKVEEKCSPEFLVAGNASVCCMSFGAPNAIQYAKEEGIGVLNIYYKDRIIANSVLWIDEGFNCLVLDNVEVHPNYTKYSEEIKELYMTAILGLMKDYNVSSTIQGHSYNDLKLYSPTDPQISIDKKKAKRVKNQNFYSDAYSSSVIKGNLNPVMA